jgi:hypothetical protein
MPSMGDYIVSVKLLLLEAAKYVSLLIISVLAIRLWRRLPKISGPNRRKNFLTACFFSMVACGISYFSVCHSLGLLYSHYGTRAFDSGNFVSAFSLFQTSSGCWKTADALGKQGVCLLLSGQPEEGIKLLDKAKAMRRSQSSFEQLYEGAHYFFHGQPDKATPLLEEASANPPYRYNATKLLAIIQLDRNQAAEAARLMNPFLQVKPEECDQAYIVASLDLLDGKKSAVKALLNRFPSENLPAFWRPRFEKLRAGIQN